MAAGVQALKADDLETAQKFLHQDLERGVKRAIVFHNVGVIAQEHRNNAQAVAWFRKSLLLDPSYGPSRLLLGSSLLSLGKTDDAVHELKRAVRSMPTEPAAHLQLAKAYQATEKCPRSGVCDPGELRPCPSRLSAGDDDRSQATENPFGHGADPPPTQEV